MLNVRYHFGKNLLRRLLGSSSDQSCVKSRNKTKYHGGMVAGAKDLDPNRRAALIGMLGEYAYCNHFDVPYEHGGFIEAGDPGFDLIVDGFKVDVKTRSRSVWYDDPVGYIRSEMANGSTVDLCKCDFYFFACLEWLKPHTAAVRILGGVSSETVLELPNVPSPIEGCDHKNKVVHHKHLDRFTLVDLWND